MSRRYVCETECYFGGRRWLPGEGLDWAGREIVQCSACSGKGKVKGDECIKCRGTGRSEPPHHFVEAEGFTPPKKTGKVFVDGQQVTKKMSDDDPYDTMKKVTDRLKELGVGYDPRLSFEKLKAKLLSTVRGRDGQQS